MPDVVGGRSYGGAAMDFSDEGTGSNSFDCGGYGEFGYVEKDDRLRMSVMMKVKTEVTSLIVYPSIYLRMNMQPRSSPGPEASRVL